MAMEEPVGKDQEAQPDSLLYELSGRWMLPIIMACLLGAGMGFLYVRRMPPIYQATTSVLAEVNARNVLKETERRDDNSRNYSVYNTREFFATQQQVLLSEDLARRVAVALDLMNRKAWLETLGPQKPDQDFHRTTLNVLSANLSVTRERFARAIEIRYTHRNPALAAEIVNSFAEEYVRRAASRRTSAEAGAERYLKSEDKRLSKELDRVDEEIAQFRETNGILSKDIENSRTLQWESLARLNQALDDVQIRRVALEERIRGLESLDRGARVAAVIADKKGGASALLAVRQNLATARAGLARERAHYHGNHPSIQELENKVMAHLAEQKTLVDDHLAHLKTERDGLGREEQSFRSRIARSKESVIQLSGLTLDYQRLVDERSGLNKLRESVRDQLLATGMALRLENNNVEILDRASAPTVPVGPFKLIYIMLGAGLALVFTVLIGLLVELTQTSVQSVEQVERLARTTCLGVVNMLRKPSDPPELTVGLQSRSTMAEQYRSIRSNLLFMNVDTPLKTITVSSPSPGDGKTFTAVSVGITLAQGESRVLLVDTDLRRGRVHRIFGVKGKAGMADLLAGTVTSEEVCKPTGIDNLDVLPSGKNPPNPAELLHSQTFRNLRDHLLERYDVIVFDTPPVNLVTDAVVLGNQTDGLLLVVRHRRTTKADVRHCAQKLSQGKVNLLGLVFNAHVLAGGLYGYYSRYGYGKYGAYYGTYGSYGSYSPQKHYGIEEV
ncbi:MAG: hypothetical protein CMH58_09605 [Myxococcales bacterium]|nr:hypothetical protein [Myxococcales bacterium]